MQDDFKDEYFLQNLELMFFGMNFSQSLELMFKIKMFILFEMEQNNRSLAIVGSRSYHDYDQFCQILEKLQEKYHILDGIVEICSGEAPGVDTLAKRWAVEKDIPYQPFPADWNKHGKSAGPIRNRQICNRMTHMVALPKGESRGTRNSIKIAHEMRKTCYIVDLE